MTTSGRTSDSEWQWVTTSSTTTDNQWQWMTMNDNEWLFQPIFFCFFWDEPTNRHPKEPFKPWGRPWRRTIELRVDLAKQAC